MSQKTVPVDGRTAKLRILDTAGQDVCPPTTLAHNLTPPLSLSFSHTHLASVRVSQDFDCLRTQWMMGKDAYIFVYSLVDSESLERLKAFYDLYKQINPAGGVPIVLAANKLDLVVRCKQGVSSALSLMSHHAVRRALATARRPGCKTCE